MSPLWGRGGRGTIESTLREPARFEERTASKMKGVPEGASVVIPRLVCRDPAAEINFCVSTFGAIEHLRRSGPDGGVAHAMIGKATVLERCSCR